MKKVICIIYLYTGCPKECCPETYENEVWRIYIIFIFDFSLVIRFRHRDMYIVSIRELKTSVA